MNNFKLSTVERRKSNRLSSKQQKPLVQKLHNRVPGRVRYKVRGLQGSENLQQYLEFSLSRKPGIDRVRASSWSGNILILFTKEYNSKAIASLIVTVVKRVSTATSKGDRANRELVAKYRQIISSYVFRILASSRNSSNFK